MRRTVNTWMVVVFLLAPASAGWGHETDQYIAPAGRDMSDHGDYFTRWIYNAIDRGVTSTNKQIRSAIQSGRKNELPKLQSDDELAHAVNREFPYAVWMIQTMDGEFTSPQMHEKYPGTVPGLKPLPSVKQVASFPLNPFRAWGCATMVVHDVQLGTDKIGHFTDMGMHYYQTYKGFLAKGETEQQAVRRAVEVGTSDPLKGESALLGEWTAGDYSNADLAVNYIGFIFYRNLTEPQMLKGVIRPPMLERDGPYWKIASHVRPDSDFFTWFISDHLDEAMNPGLFVPGMRDGMRDHIRENIEGTLEQHRDRWGNRRSQAWFAHESYQLRTYWGTDYGHRGDDKDLLLISDICFAAPKNASARDNVGRSLIHRAVALGDPRNVQRVLAGGADENDAVRSDESYNSNWGDTPLHMAAQDGREEIVRILIANGADVNRENDRGNTPLHRAVEYPNLLTVLLDGGAKVDAADAQGRTPLHWAAMGVDRGSAAALLAHGANVNARDMQGQTPLHYAARFGNGAAIEVLLANSADPNARDKFGATPLHVAAASRQAVATTALLKGGSLAAAKDDFGCTPLHDAARRGAEQVVAALLGAGVDPSAPDQQGTTPLHLAARNGYQTVAMQLMQRGASPIARAGARGTPVDEAKRAGYGALATELASTPQVASYRR